MPVIATNLDGIIEVIENKKNGLLIDVRCNEQLEKIIVGIDEEQYFDLSKKALKSFTNYDSVEQIGLFLKRIGIHV